MKKLLIILIALMSIGCSAPKTQTDTLSYEFEGTVKTTYKVYNQSNYDERLIGWTTLKDPKTGDIIKVGEKNNKLEIVRIEGDKIYVK